MCRIQEDTQETAMNTEKVRERLEQQRDELRRRISGAEDRGRAETDRGQTDTAHAWENAEVRSDLTDEAENELGAVEAALARVADGSYGVCTRCGARISDERLDLVPETALCANCARGR
jgi:RNA polymerase-binding transcription factor DksA